METKKKKLNPMLLNVILISGAVHLIAILIFGGITVVKFIVPDDAQFEEPPAVQEVEPPKEVKVEIRPQIPPQQQAMRNLRMKQVGNISVSAVDVNLPTMDQSFTVSAGLGGTGGGSLLGGTRGSIGLGASDVSVFGLKTRAERILFVLDAHRTMVYDEKGGLPGYRIIKDEIIDMVGNLSAGTLYNVMLLNGSNIKLFKPQLVPAGSEIQSQLTQWLAPVNRSLTEVGFPGGERAKVKTRVDGYEEVYEGLRRYPVQLAITQVCLEMGVDAIFELVGGHAGLTRIRLEHTPEAIAKAEETKRNYLERNPKVVKDIELHSQEIPVMKKRIQQTHAELNKKRASRGLPDKVLTGNVYHDARNLNIEWEHPQVIHPELQVLHVKWLEPRNVRQYMVNLIRQLSNNRVGALPSVNVVLFLAADEKLSEQQEKQIDDYVSLFKGKMRILRGLSEIKSASTAKDTKN